MSSRKHEDFQSLQHGQAKIWVIDTHEPHFVYATIMASLNGIWDKFIVQWLING